MIKAKYDMIWYDMINPGQGRIFLNLHTESSLYTGTVYSTGICFHQTFFFFFF